MLESFSTPSYIVIHGNYGFQMNASVNLSNTVIGINKLLTSSIANNNPVVEIPPVGFRSVSPRCRDGILALRSGS